MSHPAGTDGARYDTIIEDGHVYVGADAGRIGVGDVETILDLVGGPAWTIEYPTRQKRRYPDMDTSDEGLTVDVVDVMNAMEHDAAFVETLQAQPLAVEADGVSARTGLFVGRLLANLQYGID